MESETRKWLIQQMKKCGVKLNFFACSNYNGQLKRPKVTGNKAVAKMIVEFYKINFWNWNFNK